MQSLRRTLANFVTPTPLRRSPVTHSIPHSPTMTSASPAPEKFRIGLVQMPVGPNKYENLSLARAHIQRAYEAACAIAVLPECFVCPYDTNLFREYAEKLPAVGTVINASHGSPSLEMLQHAALDTKLYVIGGSVPELADDGKVYNTCMVVGPDGELLAKHRKAHLFDVNVPDGIVFQESDTLSPGDAVTTFHAERLGITVGIGICYDMRFAELAMMMARKEGASLLVYPGAFNLTTGPLHWELLLRARAVDNQVFVAGCSPARETDAGGYVAWGHSMLIDPWGKILSEAGVGEEMIVAVVEKAEVDKVRSSIPIGKQRRRDIYGGTFLEES